MVGQTIHSGTGLCDIFLDEEYLMNELKQLEISEDDFQDVDEKDIEFLLNPEDEDGECNDNNFKFSFE
jgi:hypothetical protein